MKLRMPCIVNRSMVIGLAILGLFTIVTLCIPQRKYRLCVVSPTNSISSASKYCPLMDSADSAAVCVLASDRLECLRRLDAGKADFAVLEAEEILISSRAPNSQVLITDELRLWKEQKYEYQMVVIVRNSLNVTKISDLRGKRFCHPGYDLHYGWTDVTSNYFEMRVVPQQCEPNMAILENHLKSSSEYFGSACKPGSWTEDETLDKKLKRKYHNLCDLCDVPAQCSTSDKYWGREGVLTCLSDEAGDVAWARLDDTLSHFGINPDGPNLAVPAEFSILCPNGYLQPLSPLTARSPPPCTWMARPWGVIAARTKMAQEIQKLVSSTKDASINSWKWALRYLLTFHRHSIIETETILTPEDYLSKANGFLSATAPSSCGLARAIKVCTLSLLEEAKCSWWRESSLAHGLVPSLSCLGPESEDGRNADTDHCLKSVAKGSADVVVINSDDQEKAEGFSLKPLLYEHSVKYSDYYIASLIVNEDSNINTLRDLKGKKACFTGYRDLGWHAMINALKLQDLLPPECPYEKAIASFFSEACVPGLNSSAPSNLLLRNLKSNCTNKADFKDKPIKHLKDEQCCGKKSNREFEAFHCLANGGDVAIVKMETVNKNKDGPHRDPWAKYFPYKNFRILCLGGNNSKNCHIGWSPKGLVMVNKNLSTTRFEEIYTVFHKMDTSFGKLNTSPRPAFQLYGPFDGRNDVIFQDSTHNLVSYSMLSSMNSLVYNFEDILKNVTICSSVTLIVPTKIMIFIAYIAIWLL